MIVREGKGKFVDHERVYEGDFVNDKMQGYGMHTVYHGGDV